MSLAYFIVLDDPDPGFDAFVNGKFIAHEAEAISVVAERLGLPSIDDFVYADADLLDDDADEDEDADTLPVADTDGGDPWFSAAEGIGYFSALRDHIQTDPTAVLDAAGVLEDLAEYLDILIKAQAAGVHWRLEVDF